MLEDHDLVDVVNGGEPVRDDEGGAAVHQLFDRLHDRSLGRGIERRGRLVEQEDRRVLEKGARDPDALPLADAQMPAALADRAFVSVRQTADELIRLRPARGIADFGVGRIGPAIGDVFANRGGKSSVSCRTIAICARSDFFVISRTSRPSSETTPALGS